MQKRLIGILIDENITATSFASTYAPIINEKMADPNVRFLVPYKPAVVWRYLVSSKFRDVHLYLPSHEFGNSNSLDSIKKMNYKIIVGNSDVSRLDIQGQADEIIS